MKEPDINTSIFREGDFIHTSNGAYAKVVRTESSTLLTVKWYPKWQWVLLRKWDALRKKVAELCNP